MILEMTLTLAVILTLALSIVLASLINDNPKYKGCPYELLGEVLGYILINGALIHFLHYLIHWIIKTHKIVCI